MTKLFAITGKKESGKTSVLVPAFHARAIALEHTIIHTRFADPLKDAIRGWLAYAHFEPETIERMIEGDMKNISCPVWGEKSTRYVMQTLGTEWGREMISSELWTGLWQWKILGTLNDPDQVIIVSDLRFPNEYEAVKQFNGKVIKIERPGLKSEDSHESETHTIPHDYLFVNSASTVEDAQTLAKAFLEQIVGF